MYDVTKRDVLTLGGDLEISRTAIINIFIIFYYLLLYFITNRLRGRAKRQLLVT